MGRAGVGTQRVKSLGTLESSFGLSHARVAQLAEQGTLNPKVQGSTPCASTIDPPGPSLCTTRNYVARSRAVLSCRRHTSRFALRSGLATARGLGSLRQRACTRPMTNRHRCPRREPSTEDTRGSPGPLPLHQASSAGSPRACVRRPQAPHRLVLQPLAGLLLSPAILATRARSARSSTRTRPAAADPNAATGGRYTSAPSPVAR